MLFQTPEFLSLFLAVLAAMVLLRTRTLQLAALLVASWVFYMSWNPAYILLLLGSTVADYLFGIAIGRAPGRKRKIPWLIASCIVNLGLLAVFKYANFFISSVNDAFAFAGSPPLLAVVKITLPVGISFYTFQKMSYIIDLFRGQMKAEKSFIRFALYVAFFPQLVAGPILRGADFMPQLYKLVNLESDNLRRGASLFMVGLVKKVLIADNISPLADFILDSPQGLDSLHILLGTLVFGIQIYCDFSGYTDMARGVGQALGYDIVINFDHPYFSRSITEFWRRWHISLSFWFRDYLYISLGGNRKGRWNTYRNLMITMALCGLWHGAKWNFVIWGVYHGVILAVERALGIGRGKPATLTQGTRGRIRDLANWIGCQYFVFLGWLIFRVRDTNDLLYCIKKFVLFDFNFHHANFGLGKLNPFLTMIMIGLFSVFHYLSYRVGGLPCAIDQLSRTRRFAVFTAACLALVWFWPIQRSAFIYFQF